MGREGEAEERGGHTDRKKEERDRQKKCSWEIVTRYGKKRVGN